MVVQCRPLGILKFLDQGVRDDKILAVPEYAPIDKYKKLSDVGEADLKIFKHFFRIYKEDIRGEVEVGDWQNGSKAQEKITDAYEQWKAR